MNDSANTSWLRPDSAKRYGTVSRFFHWVMAIGFAFIFSTVLIHRFAEKTAIDNLLLPWHRPVGALLMLLVLLRVIWALWHARQRPPHGSAAAKWGQNVLYLLMIAVPVIAMLRQHGSGRAFAPFGLPLMAAREGDKIDWMVQLGTLLHGNLGWILLVLIVGHIGMAIWHRRSDQDVLPRMLG